MKKILALAVLLTGCTTSQLNQANTLAQEAAPYVQPIADAALASSGYGAAIPAFNALSGMALAVWQQNNPVVASGGSPTAAANVLNKLPVFTSPAVKATALTMAANRLNVP